MRFLKKLFGKKQGVQVQGPERFVLCLDRQRELKYDREAFSIIEELTGVKDIDSLLAVDVKSIPILAWAGLTWADPGLSKKQVRRMIKKKIGSDLKLLGGLLWVVKDAMSFYANKTPDKKNLFSRE